MIYVRPEDFKTSFEKAFSRNEESLLKHWRGAQGKHTEEVRKILPEIASDLKLQLHNSDYYYLDAVFYEAKDTTYFPADSTYVKYVAIALEHENDVMNTQTEIIKLQLFNTPLKVLITYAGENSFNEHLQKYAKIISESDVFSDFDEKRKQLVIFGDIINNKPNWAYFLYEKKGFKRI